ncbi:unnamed protein product [Moneuplotes crassus]|uniref:Uncharacterized protein n=1 Tax=Euplotes crassus TaxID=5936 RepID=A0AAD1XTR4_EUPCR|nr:unnamed protein product [Moneuplotes crassus]
MSSVFAAGHRNLMSSHNQRPMTAQGTYYVTNYPLPKNALPPKSPMFTFPKDKSQNFLEVAQRNGEKAPGPGDYEVKSCFDTPIKTTVKASFGSTTKKKNFLDDLIRVEKRTPGPGTFNPKKKWKIVGGMDGKGYRGSFLDECEVSGKEKPGVGRYKPNYESQRPHLAIPVYRKRKSMIPKGTYEAASSFKKLEKNCSATISKSRIKSFNEQAASSKKHVPGSGYYNIEKCYSHISRPMKRGRR